MNLLLFELSVLNKPSRRKAGHKWPASPSFGNELVTILGTLQSHFSIT